MVRSRHGNQSSVTEFIILGFGDLPELQVFFFLIFLIIYLSSVAGNILIVLLVWADEHLHTPMYFFLGNLSCLETCSSTTILPLMLANFLSMDRTISVQGCVAQFFFICSLITTETWLLAIMSYDRYLAICKPLHYTTIMNLRCCSQLVMGAWVGSFVVTWILAFQLSRLYFCGPNEMDHFFCDFIKIAKLSCSDPAAMELTCFVLSFFFTALPFLLTITLYICIIVTILKIPSSTGRKKAFFTCSSHLIVVCIFYGSIIVIYMLPDTPTLRDLNKFFSVFYTVLTPLINPMIYSLRNKEVHQALRRGCSKLATFVGIQLNSSLSFQFIRYSEH